MRISPLQPAPTVIRLNTADPSNTAEPTFAELLERGRGFLRGQDHRAALAIADRLLRDFDPRPDALLFAGEVHFFRGNFFGTEELARRCQDEFPDDVSGAIMMCRALIAQGKHGEARDLALETAEREITSEQHVDILVTILSGTLVPEAAYPIARAAVERDPYNPAAHRRLALNCRLIGKLDEALDSAKIALRFNAHDYEMIGLRSALKTATDSDNNIAELESLLAAGCRDALGAARVAYALAKECEDTGQHTRSFGFLQAGARFKRQTLNFRPEEDIRTFEMLAEKFTADSFSKAGPGHDSREPVFILGLPRTGSTLLERILSSHSDVHAAGELFHFDAALMTEIRKLGPIADRADMIEKSKNLDMRVVGRSYIERTRPYTGHTPRFIDKRPLNFISLGPIRLALPGAKVIHVRRTPLDACYSIYKFLFNDAYPWSYDLTEIANFYVAYRKLMDHWRNVMPGYITDVVYEDVVNDLEGEARKLLAAMDLMWEPAVLEFHQNEQATMTGSAVQVRQKIYASSVGRWRNYEDELQPVADILEKADIDPYNP